MSILSRKPTIPPNPKDEDDFRLFCEFQGEVLSVCKVNMFVRSKCKHFIPSKTDIQGGVANCAWFDPTEHSCLKPI